MELMAMLCEYCETSADITSKLKTLFTDILEKMLESETEEHLGYDMHSAAGSNSDSPHNDLPASYP